MRIALLVLLASEVVYVGVGSPAYADERFGDSTWVAPAWPIEGDVAADGPRVAPSNHERRWETALRAPFRVVFLPLRLMGAGLQASAGYFGTRFLEPKPKRAPKSGPRLSPHIHFGTVNDIGVGPAVNWVGFPTANARLRLTATYSSIDRRRVSFTETIGERQPVGFRLRATYDYKPNRKYYGVGNETPGTNLSYFLLATSNVEAALLLGASRLRQVRIIGGYSSMTPGRGYHGQPLVEDVFAPANAPFMHRTTQELSYGISADLAALDDGRDPSRGVHGRADLRRLTGVRSSDPDYDQWFVEGRAYVPVFAKRRVIAVRGVYAGVDPRGSTTASMPFYRLAQSHSPNSFVGYASERFRDRQLMLARIEYRWVILRQMSALALYELGEVAPNRQSFTLRDTHRSYGGGLRLALSDEVTVRFEVGKSVEGYHPVLVLGGDF